MRILHAPSNIANQAWALARGMRALGHEVEVWHYGPNRFGFPCDRQVPYPPQRGSDLLPLVQEAIERFDVLHFHFARTLMPRQQDWMPGYWDLPLYRSANKKVVFTFHGSDVRVPSEHRARDEWSYFSADDVRDDEDEIGKRLEIARAYADALFVSSPIDEQWVPDARFHARALWLEDWPYRGPAGGAVPVIGHMPSKRGTKGTPFVQRAVDELRARGVAFEYRMIEGVSREKIPDALAGIDVLIDNILLDDYGVTGIEAMATGPVVIARQAPAVAARYGEAPPVVHADPSTLTAALERVLGDAPSRERLSGLGRAWVERHHDARVVAAGLVDVYREQGSGPPVGFPGWASFGQTGRIEVLDRQVRELTTALRSRGREVVVAGTRRGPFTLAGARADRLLRRLRRR